MIIYKATNLINNKIYIGQTVNDLKIRIKQHEKCYGYGRDYAFPRAINKYGKQNFKWEIIDSANSIQELNEKENYYISKYNSINPNYGYNLRCGGDNKFLSNDVKIKISSAQKGDLNHMYGKTGNKNITSKAVKNITTGATYGSAMECARELGLNNSHISAVCRGERGSTGGMVFRYLTDDGKIVEPKYTTNIKARKVINIDTKEVFNSLADAERKYSGKCSGCLSKVCGVKDRTFAGYKWKYVD